MFGKKHRHMVILQKPNAPIIVWFVSFISLRIALFEPYYPLLELVSFGAIFTWAWLEIVSGDSAFRVVLGWTVMITILYLRVV